VKTLDQLIADLTGLLHQTFPDREYSGPIGVETRLFGDLGLASIEVVVLAERLEQFYGRRLAFGPFLAGLRDRGADDLELGEVVNFLRRQGV
jgi:acyl carrier protein